LTPRFSAQIVEKGKVLSTFPKVVRACSRVWGEAPMWRRRLCNWPGDSVRAIDDSGKQKRRRAGRLQYRKKL